MSLMFFNFTRYFGVSLLPVVFCREVEGGMIFKISYKLVCPFKMFGIIAVFAVAD